MLDKGFLLSKHPNKIKGAGSKTIEKLISIAGQQGNGKIIIDSLPEAIAFYEKMGFSVIDKEDPARMMFDTNKNRNYAESKNTIENIEEISPLVLALPKSDHPLFNLYLGESRFS